MYEGAWMGLARHVDHYLRTVGADHETNEDGEVVWLLDGLPQFGLGGDECIISEEVRYFINGEPHSLSVGMNSTSYGLRGVRVI